MIGSLIGLFFGALWLSVAVGATPAPWTLVAGAIGALLFLGGALRVVLRRPPRGGRFDRRWYIAAVIAEVVAIGFVQAWLARHGRNDLLLPSVGVIVGLHFIGLWRAIGLKRFLGLSAALVAINLVALLAPLAPDARSMVSGYGSAAALLMTAAL